MKYLLILCLLLVGCDQEIRDKARVENEAYYKLRADLDEQAARLCLEMGGIPQRSSWDGKVYDCKLIKEVK